LFKSKDFTLFKGEWERKKYIMKQNHVMKTKEQNEEMIWREFCNARCFMQSFSEYCMGVAQPNENSYLILTIDYSQAISLPSFISNYTQPDYFQIIYRLLTDIAKKMFYVNNNYTAIHGNLTLNSVFFILQKSNTRQRQPLESFIVNFEHLHFIKKKEYRESYQYSKYSNLFIDPILAKEKYKKD
jgi:hypothetical protein